MVCAVFHVPIFIDCAQLQTGIKKMTIPATHAKIF
jgi:hypothetical protein